jgi:hypothetical protein
MAEKRQFEVLLVRLVPHALRDDFMTVGVVVLEPGKLPNEASGKGTEQFADFRITRDWKRVACFAPDFEMETLEYLEMEVRSKLKDMHGRNDLVHLLGERFGSAFDVGPVKAMVAENPAAEMRVLERDYLDPIAEGGREERARRMGRLGIVAKMQDAFSAAGVLEMMSRDLDMREFTGEHDPFRVDFGFRVGKSVRMFQGLALNMSREPAVTLAYRYERIQAGLRGRGEEALMTAIISEGAGQRGARSESRVALSSREVAAGIAMLRANEIAVREVREMATIAEEVRREIGS